MADSNQMNLSQAIAKMIKAYDVEHIFTVAGSPLNILYHCQVDEGIKVVLGRSERSVMSMADGYARLNGKPAFGYVQFGVGACALPPVFSEASWGQSPLIVISGSTNTNTRDRYEYQEVDSLPMMSSCTKWAGAMPAPDRVPDILRTIMRTTLSGIPGPAFLEVPANTFRAPLSADPDIRPDAGFKRVGERPVAADAAAVERLIGLLSKAERPVILSGGETIFSEAWPELVAFAEALQIPVATSTAGKGGIAETHPLALGVIGRYGRRVTNEVAVECDLMIVVGSQLSAMTTHTFNFPPQGTKIAHFSVDPTSLGRTYAEEISINADARSALQAILAAAEAAGLDGSKWADWTAACQQRVADWRQKYSDLAAETVINGRINPRHLMKVLDDHVAGDDLVIGDTGSASRWTGSLVETKSAGRTFQRAAGSLGWAFPGGLGAKLAVGKSRRVFTVIGDGGLGYHIGDLETAVRMDIPAITIVMNNASFAGYRGLLNNNMGEETELPAELSTFNDVRFADVAKGFDAFGERVEDPDEIAPALRRAEESGKPALLDVVVDGTIAAPGMGLRAEI